MRLKVYKIGGNRVGVIAVVLNMVREDGVNAASTGALRVTRRFLLLL